MAGAYTAKPADAVADPKPPGWGDWPWPGPLPPGYGMELSLNLTAAAVYVPAAAHDATVSLRDQVDYGTTEPDGPNEITWTATLDGVSMQLKLDGGVYASYIESNYADIGDYWGAEPTFVFPVTLFEGGSVITLTASSVNPFTGYVVGDVSANIGVYDPVFSLSMSADSPIDWDETSAVEVVLEDNESSWTIEPVGYEITFTATVNGRECMDPLTIDYSAVGDSWGHTDDFTFDLTEDDAEKTIILTAESTIWGDEVSDEVEIEINPLPIPVSISTSLVFNSYTIEAASATKMRLKVERLPSHSSRRDWPQIGANEYGAPPPSWWESNAIDNLAEITCATNINGTKSITAEGTLNADSNYKLTYDINEGGNATVDVTFSISVTMSDGTIHSDSVNHVIAPYGSTEVEYVTVSTATGVVVIFGTTYN